MMNKVVDNGYGGKDDTYEVARNWNNNSSPFYFVYTIVENKA